VLQELTDAGAVNATYTTEDDSYYGTLLHLKRATGESRFPLYDEIGSARGLVDANGAVTDTYEMDTFGKPVSTTGSTPNPYRYGAAWGYITDPSGFLQLGARFYWPEVGRFVSQDPEGEEGNWYAYALDNPVVWDDAEGLAAGQSLRGHGRAFGGRGPGGAGLRRGVGRRPCPTPPAKAKPKPPKPKPKPKPRSPECKQCDADYRSRFEAIRAGVVGGNAARAAAGIAVFKATGSTSCGGAVSAAAVPGQMMSFITALAATQVMYQDCCEKYHCEQLPLGKVVPGLSSR
jgi:RHS repeat-associated protein